MDYKQREDAMFAEKTKLSYHQKNVLDRAFGFFDDGKPRWEIHHEERPMGGVYYKLRFWLHRRWYDHVKEFSSTAEIVKLVEIDYLFD